MKLKKTHTHKKNFFGRIRGLITSRALFGIGARASEYWKNTSHAELSRENVCRS